ncbi:MAG: bifunctional phosphopantothenoylcysteine decarboxylase/phosphopantothenate--cysteine ligase CoaBC [Thermoplasmata archaeon]|nr:bifunctional phosphopantothenoylcysteine decarboxylase/phosphopantothenate--cysteine ligase CoaBC [Thermoplasmata archaeon]
MHPSEAIKESISKKLSGKKIILALTGGIACVECVKLARQLIRHGADVYAVMSKEACRILSTIAMEFATGKEVITELGGKVEHVSHDADLMLIAPCTANTVAKIALGIADNAVTTFAIAFDGKILLAPSMHLSMYENEFFKENLRRCEEKGIGVIPPKIEENKAKMADVDRIVAEVLRELRGDKKGKKILVIGGATQEAIDDVRVITNLSSGKMARAIANEAYERGMEVTVWASFDMPDYIKTKKFRSVNDLINLVEKAKEKYDAVINCAAISDFVVDKKKGKISSGKEIMLKLKPAPRINPMLRKIGKTIVAFKLEEKKESLEKKAREMIARDGVDIVIGNTLESLGKDTAKIWIMDKNGVIARAEGKKEEIAEKIIDLI